MPTFRARALSLSLSLSSCSLSLSDFMGSAASLPATLPDSIDEATAKTLAGDKFDQALFDKSKDETGNITKEQFTEIWNKSLPAATTTTTTMSGEAKQPGPEPDVTPVDLEVQKKFHSMSRWNKPSEEIAAFVSENPGSQNSVDAANGNYPLHIAAQNGHVDLVRQLLSIGVLVDAPNGTGTTALHMAKAYDYFWCARFILAAGANPDVLNGEGNKACEGIDGDKVGLDWIPALTSAHTAAELDEALTGLMTQETIDKSGLVMGGMQKKKSAKDIWTPEVQERFKEICKKC